jgi:hypothetical protein
MPKAKPFEDRLCFSVYSARPSVGTHNEKSRIFPDNAGWPACMST